MDTFARTLLRMYDKKLMSGQITFSRSGIQKGDFNQMCTDSSYIIPKDRTLHICECMDLSDEEKELLLSFYED